MAETQVEVSIPQDLLEKILASVTPNAVLVGGQSLAFWVSHYGVQLPPQFQVGAISDDADFLGGREDVTSIARRVDGIPEYTSQRFMSALVGQVKIPLSRLEYVNVDVLHRLVGLTAQSVRERASIVTVGSTEFLVMHPLDVFLSRIENLAQLADKQNPQGIEQAKLGVLVAHNYIEEIAKELPDGQKHALKTIEYVVKVAKSGAGRKVSRDFGIDFRGAIPGYAIIVEAFHKVRYPQILQELQPPAKTGATPSSKRLSSNEALTTVEMV